MVVGAQSSHSGGKPINHPTKAGANAPGFSVVSDDPASAGPSAFAITCSEVMQLRGPPFMRAFIARCASGDLLSSFATGVGQSARAVSRRACIASPISRPSAIRRSIPGSRQSSLSPSLASGVCHKPKAVATVGRVDGTSRDNDRPAGVVDACQVRSNSVEPVLANRRRNLLSHEDSGPSGTDEAKQVGPQVPIVSLGFAFAGDRERLTRA